MIALWMVYATIVGMILAAGAALVERAAGGGLRQRRWISMLALALSVMVPAWTVVAPQRTVLLEAPAAGDAGARGQHPATASLTRVSSGLAGLIARADTRTLDRLDASLAVAWAIAALLALGTYGAATVLLARRRRTWRRAELDGEVVLLAPMAGPAVIGTLRPEIVVPEWSLTLPAEQRALMIEHERQHVRAKDPLVLHAAAMVALFMPWNVAAWWLNRRLRLAVELDCDARVLGRGHDRRAYGTLLVDVCARRSGSGPLLAPALLERTSSLAKRIIAMQPHRARFPRTQIALASVVAAAVTIIACETPSPEALAPDGNDVRMKRLYGEVNRVVDARNAQAGRTAGEIRKTITQYFPSVARGEGGPSILYLVRSADGKVVLTQSQAAAFARTPASPEDTVRLRSPAAGIVEPANRIQKLGLAMRESREPMVSRQSAVAATPNEVRSKMRRPGAQALFPSGVGALLPDDIQSVDITKHAAGAVAPNAVSVITIVLKPDAKVPTVARTP